MDKSVLITVSSSCVNSWFKSTDLPAFRKSVRVGIKLKRQRAKKRVLTVEERATD